jgi:hypothetical protein
MKGMAMRRITTPIVPVFIAVVAAGGGAALATAGDARADTAGMQVAANETLDTASGYVTFRSERYRLSDQAVVSTSSTTIRITDPAAINQQGTQTASLYVVLGYARDPLQPTILRVNSGVAVRGYDFATGTYDPAQAIQIGPGSLAAVESSNPVDPDRVVGHLGSRTERGIDLDVIGLHFG